MAFTKVYETQNKRGYYNTKKRQRKALLNQIYFLFGCMGVGALMIGIVWFTGLSEFSYQIAPVEAKEIEKPLTPIEYALKEVDKAGINKYKVIALLNCENKTFSTEARLINKDGKSVDRGFWQINDKFHSEVSNSCAYDLECSTKEAIRILKQRGFQEWSCGKDLGSIK